MPCLEKKKLLRILGVTLFREAPCNQSGANTLPFWSSSFWCSFRCPPPTCRSIGKCSRRTLWLLPFVHIRKSVRTGLTESRGHLHWKSTLNRAFTVLQFSNFLVVPCIHFLLSVEFKRCLADVAFFPSSTLTPAFQHSRNFWAKLFPRPFLTQPEGSGVQTSWALPFRVSILGLSDVMACELTSSIFAKYKWSTNYWRWQRPWSDEGINMGMIGFTKMP